MHVVLVGAEFEENLAVRYLRGALEHAGHPVTTVIFNEADDTERAAREIVASGAPLTGFSMVFTYRAREFARLAQRARELGPGLDCRRVRWLGAAGSRRALGSCAGDSAWPTRFRSVARSLRRVLSELPAR